jgi:hypothetical protein
MWKARDSRRSPERALADRRKEAHDAAEGLVADRARRRHALHLLIAVRRRSRTRSADAD